MDQPSGRISRRYRSTQTTTLHESPNAPGILRLPAYGATVRAISIVNTPRSTMIPQAGHFHVAGIQTSGYVCRTNNINRSPSVRIRPIAMTGVFCLQTAEVTIHLMRGLVTYSRIQGVPEFRRLAESTGSLFTFCNTEVWHNSFSFSRKPC